MKQKKVLKKPLSLQQLLDLVIENILSDNEEGWRQSLHLLKDVAYQEGFDKGYDAGFVDKDSLPF